MNSAFAEINIEKHFSSKSLNMKEECVHMYSELDNGKRYPVDTMKSDNFCVLNGKSMSSSDYTFLLHRSMRMSCKGKREFLFEIASLLSGCNGKQVYLSTYKNPNGSCDIISNLNKDKITIPKESVSEFKEKYENLSLLEKAFMPNGTEEILDVVQKCY